MRGEAQLCFTPPFFYNACSLELLPVLEFSADHSRCFQTDQNFAICSSPVITKRTSCVEASLGRSVAFLSALMANRLDSLPPRR